VLSSAVLETEIAASLAVLSSFVYYCIHQYAKPIWELMTGMRLAHPDW
jgi:hypothetical protein